jgi:hypothetical protein
VETGGPVVDAVWRRLLDRAGPRRLPPLTTDPDVHLMVDGRRIDPVRQERGVAVFDLPFCPSCVDIVSRDAIPSELGTARDSRSLGVALRTIQLHQPGSGTVTLGADDSRLQDGFNGYEAADQLRWTTGCARLPSSLFEMFDTGPLRITLQLCGETQYLVWAGNTLSSVA